MIYLILDTNIWVYLANGFDPVTERQQDNLHFSLLSSLKFHRDKRDITVLVNDIILNEWKRNKNHCETKVETLKNKLLHPNSPFSEISRYTNTNIEELKVAYIEGLKKAIEENQKHINDVESFLYNDCVKIGIPDSVKLQIFELSVNNKAPFHNKKNNVADASILFGAAAYLSDKLSDDNTAIFVSYNFKDFTNGQDKKEFHPDIQEYLSHIDIKYEQLLPSALNLSRSIIAQVEEYYKHEAWLESIRFSCRSQYCYRTENYNAEGYLDSQLTVRADSDILFDPNQLSLFPDLPNIIRQPQVVNTGCCSICSTQHIECPECKELICIEDPDEIFQCLECGIELELRYDRKSAENSVFILDTYEEEIGLDDFEI